MLNLLPWREEEKNRCKRRQLITLGCLVTLIYLMAYGYRFVIVTKIRQTTHANQLLEQQIKEQSAIQQILAKELTTYQYYVHKNKLYKRQWQVADTLTLICSSFPDNCELNSLLLNEKGLVLDGVMDSENKRAMIDFVSRLQRSCKSKVKMLENALKDQQIFFTIAIIFSNLA